MFKEVRLLLFGAVAPRAAFYYYAACGAANAGPPRYVLLEYSWVKQGSGGKLRGYCDYGVCGGS